MLRFYAKQLIRSDAIYTKSQILNFQRHYLYKIHPILEERNGPIEFATNKVFKIRNPKAKNKKFEKTFPSKQINLFSYFI